MRVKCEDCGHQADIMGDTKSTWLCPCAAVRQDCDCGHLNVAAEDVEAGLVVADHEVG